MLFSTHRRLTAAIFSSIGIVSLLLSGATAQAAATRKHHQPVHHATLHVLPGCLSVGHKHRKLHVTMRHGVHGDHYTFAMLPLFANGKVTGPAMGRFKADSSGKIQFTFPAPNHKRDVGKWQVTATRKMGKRFKLAALTHFNVRWSKCGK